jgi:hypothetical protein
LTYSLTGSAGAVRCPPVILLTAPPAASRYPLAMDRPSYRLLTQRDGTSNVRITAADGSTRTLIGFANQEQARAWAELAMQRMMEAEHPIDA